MNSILLDPSVYSNYVKVAEIQAQLEFLEKQNQEYTDEWVGLVEDLESM